jgi:D-alanyl-D-alanine carboxypeptidase
MFTAASILKLAEAGKLSLDDALSLYLQNTPEAGSVTIRHLLNHSAGISDVAKDPPPWFGRRDVDSTARVADISTLGSIEPAEH